MRHISYKTSSTCARQIDFDLTDDNKITNLAFIGGCNGNLKAISKICEGMDASKVMNIFSGNICGMKGTSWADQLSLAIGKAGQNARLAAKLTNWKIDIKSESQFREILQKKDEEEVVENQEEE